MSKRSERVASTIQRSVQAVIAKGMSDPRIRGLVTVTRVQATEDLRTATIFVSVLPAEHADLTLHGLRAASRHIRHQIADDLVLPKTPELIFKLDHGARQQAEVMAALARVRAELQDSAQGENDEQSEEQDEQGEDARE